MEFFEEGKHWTHIPPWVMESIRLGYKWRKLSNGKRRIGLLSMPCETQTAALIALGVLRYDLENPKGNNKDSHFNSIIQARKNHFKNKQDSNNPISLTERWHVRNIKDGSTWFFEESDAKLESVSLKYSKYRPKVKRAGKLVENLDGRCKRYIFKSNAMDWQLQNRPIPEASNSSESLNQNIYNNLGSFDIPVFEENLRSSYNGLVLVANASSESSKYVKKLNQIGFVIDEIECNLTSLLTINFEQGSKVERLKLLNENCLEDDDTSKLIIADGASALLKAEIKYPNSDIISVYNRCGSLESTERLRSWIGEKERYYSRPNNEKLLSNDLEGIKFHLLERLD